MADEKQPVEKAVELFVYAPVGVALYVRDMLPSMMGVFVSRGKREVQSHIPGRAPAPPTPPPMPPMPPEVKRRIDESVGVARYMAEGGLGVAPRVRGQRHRRRPRGGGQCARAVPRHARQRHADGRRDRRETRRRGGGVGAARHRAGTSCCGIRAVPLRRLPLPPPAEMSWQTEVPSAETLPIPDYDELSASQVVERLEGLDRESLDAIRRYETAHRGRNTILGKIAQLS